MRTHLKITVTAVLVAVIALSAAYVFVNQNTATTPDKPPTLAITNDDAISPENQLPFASYPDPGISPPVHCVFSR